MSKGDTKFTPLLAEIDAEKVRLKAAKTTEEKVDAQSSMLSLVGVAQKEAHLERRAQDKKLDAMGGDVKDILEQTRITNGSVKSLRAWREQAAQELLGMSENQKKIANNMREATEEIHSVTEDLEAFKIKHGPETDEGKAVKALVLLRQHWKGWTIGVGAVGAVIFFLLKYKVILINVGS